MKPFKVLICEINHFHAEILPVYSQLLPFFLNLPQEKLQFDYLLSPEIYDDARWIVKSHKFLLEGRWLKKIISKTGLRVFYYHFLLNKFIKKIKPDLIVFNTIESKRLVSVFNKIKHTPKLALIHNLSEKVYAQLDFHKPLLFCLNRHVYDHWENKNILIGYFTSAFPAFLFKNYAKPNRNYREISVPGRIDFKKRDYNELVKLCLFLRNHHMTDIRFNLLTNSREKEGPLFKKKITEMGLNHFFIFHTERLTEEKFTQAIFFSDYILPLIKTNSVYTKGVTSASFVHSYAYRKPLIILTDIAMMLKIPKNACLAYEKFSDLLTLLQLSPAEITQSYEQHVETLIQDNKKNLMNLATTKSNT